MPALLEDPVENYFEEAKLPRIHVGNKIQLMGDSGRLSGHVASIAARIKDRDRTDGTNLLANLTLTLNWVRLAPRVLVRIALDHVPNPTGLVAGRTATSMSSG